MEKVVERVKLQGNNYNKYSNEQKLLSVYFNRVKLFNAAKSGRLAGGIAERTAQKWAKRFKEDKNWNILGKQTNLINRPKLQIGQEHKDHLTEYNFSFKKVSLQPVARNDTTKIANRLAWVTQCTATDTNYLKNCVFVGESAFHINMRPLAGWSEKGKIAIVTTPSTRAITHIVLGAISAKFAISMELRNPQEEWPKRLKLDHGSRKRKVPSNKKKPARKRAFTGHYLKFLDEMDHFLDLKGHYIVMDNASIHTAKEIDELITIKNKVKRREFKDKEDLVTRITGACNSVPPNHLRAFVQHSVNVFEKCMNEEPI
ncbi:hypothetical protein G6F43_009119 [Rhizopus delemar]|nr:hypothetical protein G6F43_009119 [Rhizopus delemar]